MGDIVKKQREPRKIRPYGASALVRLDDKQTMVGLLHIPQIGQEQPVLGTVVAVGPGWTEDDGRFIGINLKPGDKVVMGKYNGDEVDTGEEGEYRLCRFRKHEYIPMRLDPWDYPDIYGVVVRDEDA